MNPDSETRLKKRFQTALMIHLAMMNTIFVYGIVAWIMTKSLPKASTIQNIIIIKYALYGLAIVELFLPILFQKIMLTPKNSIPEGPPIETKLFTSSVITVAFCEATAIYGLILSILTRSMNDFYALGFLSLVSFVIYFPKFNRWQYLAENTSKTHVSNSQ